jgi:hypothetical protein
MLTPHELATLILVANTPEQVDTRRPDFINLLEHGLVHIEENSMSQERHPRISRFGHRLIEQIGVRRGIRD